MICRYPPSIVEYSTCTRAFALSRPVSPIKSDLPPRVALRCGRAVRDTMQVPRQPLSLGPPVKAILHVRLSTNTPRPLKVRNLPVKAPIPLPTPPQRLRLRASRLARLGINIPLELGPRVLEEGVVLRAARDLARRGLLCLLHEGFEFCLFFFGEAGGCRRGGGELGVGSREEGCGAEGEGARGGSREAEEGGHFGLLFEGRDVVGMVGGRCELRRLGCVVLLGVAGLGGAPGARLGPGRPVIMAEVAMEAYVIRDSPSVLVCTLRILCGSGAGRRGGKGRQVGDQRAD